jgi:hypothetical protein
MKRTLLFVSAIVIAAIGACTSPDQHVFTQCAVPFTMANPVARLLFKDEARGCYGLRFNIPQQFEIKEHDKSTLAAHFTVRVPQEHIGSNLSRRFDGIVDVRVDTIYGSWSTFAKNATESKIWSGRFKRTGEIVGGMELLESSPGFPFPLLRGWLFIPRAEKRLFVEFTTSSEKTLSDIAPYPVLSVHSDVDNVVEVEYQLTLAELQQLDTINRRVVSLVSSWLEPLSGAQPSDTITKE